MRPPPIPISRLLAVVCLLLGLVVSPQVCGQNVALESDVVLRSVGLPWGDEVLFECPSDWPIALIIAEGSRYPVPTVEMKPDRDSLVLVSITPYAALGERLSDDEIRSTVYGFGTRWLPRAVESEIILHELSGKYGSGYYFSITDSAPNPDDPDDYEFLNQGLADIGYAVILFSILSDIKDSEAVNQAFEALRSIQYVNRKDVKSIET